MFARLGASDEMNSRRLAHESQGRGCLPIEAFGRSSPGQYVKAFAKDPSSTGRIASSVPPGCAAEDDM
jgi:hypothetical protein